MTGRNGALQVKIDLSTSSNAETVSFVQPPFDALLRKTLSTIFIAIIKFK